MDLTNKHVTLTSLTSTSFPEMSRAMVIITQEVSPGIQKTVGSYALEIDRVFSSVSDPALLSAIQQMLESIPE